MADLSEIRVTGSSPYSVWIGRNCLERIGRIAARTLDPDRICRILIITDDRVAPLYLADTAASFHAAGFAVCPGAFILPAGETSKNFDTLAHLLGFLAEAQLTRNDLLIALGGGVVSDLTGLAASLYLRGIRWMPIATTTLAAADASIGGKTAIDLPNGKNLVGAFHQPAAVFCDTAFFDTLPPSVLREGLVESLKCGLIAHTVVSAGNMSLLDAFLEPDWPKNITNIIFGAAGIKAALVSVDEQDNGQRKLLNLGHTVGHAIETCSHYTVSHGAAVAAGLQIITRAAVSKNLCEAALPAVLHKALDHLGLAGIPTAYSADELAEAALHDKKRIGDTITLVLPESIGHCVLHPIPVADLKNWIAAGLSGKDPYD